MPLAHLRKHSSVKWPLHSLVSLVPSSFSSCCKIWGQGLRTRLQYSNSEVALPLRLVRLWPDHFSAGRWSHSQTASAPTCYKCVYDVQLLARWHIPLLAVVLLSLASPPAPPVHMPESSFICSGPTTFEMLAPPLQFYWSGSIFCASAPQYVVYSVCFLKCVPQYVVYSVCFLKCVPQYFPSSLSSLYVQCLSFPSSWNSPVGHPAWSQGVTLSSET